MMKKTPVTIYYLGEPLRSEIKKEALKRNNLSLSRLIRILNTKWFKGEILLDQKDMEII